MTTKERPILFSGPMVRSILDGRKTQTRRAVKFVQFDRSDTPGYDWHFRGTAKGTKRSSLWQDMRHEQILSMCPYGKPGDRLWVRETWLCATGEPGPMLCHYQADGDRPEFNGLWKPSIHMFRWASRITLEITGVRVERLQGISEADAIAEGVECCSGWIGHAGEPRRIFCDLWKSINGPESWAANPWVWVVEFRRCEQ
jgi:hypothetical protein